MEGKLMYKISTIAVLAFLSLNLALPFSYAEDQAEQLAPIKVTATRDSTTEENIPSSFSVITAEDIKKKQYIQVQDLLREELGMNIVRNGTVGAQTNIFMRGTGSSSTLVIIDGVRANSNTTGGFDFHDLTTDNIERIEIIRGPQSTLWGADAVGGVVNIITKKGKGEPSHQFAFEGGSFGTFKETASSSGSNEKFDYSLNVSRIDSSGFSSANEQRGNTERDTYENTTVSMRAGANFLNDGRIEFVGRHTKSLVGYDGFSFSTGLPTDAPNRSNTESYYLAIPVSKSITDWWNVKLTPNAAYDELRIFDGSRSPQNSSIFNRTHRLDLQNNVTLNKFFSVVFGADLREQSGELTSSSLTKTIDNQGYYLQNVFSYDECVILTGGFRHDINSVFHDKTTYKVEGAYCFKESGTRIRSAHATGFRAPSINDLFFPGFGNPNLKPEESKSWEVGIDQTFFEKKLKVGTTYFDSKLDNLIQFDSATFLPQNIAKATSKGTETYIKVQPFKTLGLSLNHTWNDAFDGVGQRLRRRPEHKLSGNIYQDWNDRLSSLIGVTYKTGITDGRYNTSDYAIVRAALSYQLLKSLKLTLRGENLFNEKYEEIPGYGTAGISGYAGVLYNF